MVYLPPVFLSNRTGFFYVYTKSCDPTCYYLEIIRPMKESNFQSYSTVASWLPWYKARSNLLIKVVHVFSMSTSTTPTTVIVKITNVRSVCHIFYQLFHQICPCIVRYTGTNPFLSFHFWKIRCWKTSNILRISRKCVAPFRWQLSSLRPAKNKQN